MSNPPHDALPAGKLPPELLATLLRDLAAPAPDVVIGARYGEDAAVVEVGDRYLVLALDPVTMSAAPGHIAVQINANDLAVMGAEPRWLLAAILLPLRTAAGEVQRIMGELRRGCAELGVVLIGGHTEVTPAVTQPVVAACMVGQVPRDRLVTSAGAQPGDAVLLVGEIAVEGTGILGREYGAALRRAGVADEVIREAAALLDDPGISVVPAVRVLLAAALPHAMHDPTEGGVLSALRELASASGAGVRLHADVIPILPSCHAICRALGLDPLGLLASGSLLAAIAPGDVPAVGRALAGAGIPAAVIGTILPPGEGMVMAQDGQEIPLPDLARDELARWIEESS